MSPEFRLFLYINASNYMIPKLWLSAWCLKWYSTWLYTSYLDAASSVFLCTLFPLFWDTSWVEECPFFFFGGICIRSERKKPSNHCFLHSQRWPTNSAVESPLRLLSHSKSSESWIDPVGGTVVPFVEKQMLMMLMLKVYIYIYTNFQETYLSHVGKNKFIFKHAKR